MNKSEKLRYIEQMMWDSSISPEDILAVLEGRISKVKNFDKSVLLKRVVESYPWFTVIRLFTPEQLRRLLSEELIGKLRSASLRHQYEYARTRLQKIM